MDKRRGKTKRERKRKEEEEKRKREEKKKIKKNKKGILDIYNFNLTGEAVLPNVFQNASSTKEAAPPKKPEPELFLEEPEPCQTDSIKASDELPKSIRSSRSGVTKSRKTRACCRRADTG